MEESDPRRRFPRIFLVGIHDLPEITGARVEWENAQRTDILDMSYSGMAVARPSGIEFEKGKVIRAKVLFASLPAQNLEFELVRETEKIFGVHFNDLTKENVDVLDKFLSDKLLGRSIRVVNPQFFHRSHDFNHWLHGPNNTNLYIWTGDHKIRKSVFEMSGSALLYEGGAFSHQKLMIRPEDDDYVVFPLAHAKEVKNLRDFLVKSLKILSHVEEAPAPFWTLIDILKAETEKEMMEFFNYRRRIHYYETDAMAIVHHSNHLRLFEEARVAWFGAREMDKIAWTQEQLYFPLLDKSVKYMKPIYFDDEVKVSLQVNLSKRRFTFEYSIYVLSVGTDQRSKAYSRSRGGLPLLCALGSTSHVLVDKEFNIVKELNPQILKIMEAEPWTETWP